MNLFDVLQDATKMADLLIDLCNKDCKESSINISQHFKTLLRFLNDKLINLFILSFVRASVHHENVQPILSGISVRSSYLFRSKWFRRFPTFTSTFPTSRNTWPSPRRPFTSQESRIRFQRARDTSQFKSIIFHAIIDFPTQVEVLSSLQKPKKVTFKGSDGKNYVMLCKPKVVFDDVAEQNVLTDD